jgi:exosome complex RNA-binding protein Csl4
MATVGNAVVSAAVGVADGSSESVGSVEESSSSGTLADELSDCVAAMDDVRADVVTNDVMPLRSAIVAD